MSDPADEAWISPFRRLYPSFSCTLDYPTTPCFFLLRISSLRLSKLLPRLTGKRRHSRDDDKEPDSTQFRPDDLQHSDASRFLDLPTDAREYFGRGSLVDVVRKIFDKVELPKSNIDV